MIPIYKSYITEDGNKGIKARLWHPDWFMPILKTSVVYWLGFWRRYKKYQEALALINNILRYDNQYQIDGISGIINNIDCGFECAYTKPYGFVPEASCPIHDSVTDESGWKIEQ